MQSSTSVYPAPRSFWKVKLRSFARNCEDGGGRLVKRCSLCTKMLMVLAFPRPTNAIAHKSLAVILFSTPWEIVLPHFASENANQLPWKRLYE